MLDFPWILMKSLFINGFWDQKKFLSARKFDER